MGIVIRQSIKSSIVSYLGIGIGTINILWLSPFFLLPKELGLTRFITESAVFFASFAHLGSAFVADRFFPLFKNEENKHNALFVFLMIYPLLGFFVFIFLFFLFNEYLLNYYSGSSPLLSDFFYFIVPITFFYMYSIVLESYIRVHNRIVVPAIIREIFLKLMNVILIVLYGLNIIKLQELVFGVVLSFGMGVGLLLMYIKSLGKLYFSFKSEIWNVTLFRKICSYGFFMVLGGIGMIITSKIDVFMLPAYTGLDLTGVYVVAMFIGTVIEIPKRSISQISSPLISQYWYNEDLNKIEELYKKSSVNLLIAAFILFILIWSNIDSLFSLIPNSEVYKQGKYVVLWVAVAKLIDMSTGVNGEIILYSKYYKVSFYYVAFLAVFTVITNLLFIPAYGIIGAAAATSLSIFCYTCLKVGYVWYKFRILPFENNSIKIVLIALFTYFISTIIPEFGSSLHVYIFSIIVKCVTSILIFFPLVFYFQVSEDLNKLLILFKNRIF